MKVLSSSTKFAHLGKPGSIFSKGFERRLNKVTDQINLTDKKILDQGCGEGVWLAAFAKYTSPSNIFGFDIDSELIDQLKAELSKKESKLKIPDENIKVCKAEDLEFKEDFFDVVFSNEVLEHVEDDKKSTDEVNRVLKKDGYFVVFTPNRGWPFETHGIFFNGKYYWGNIPFLPWMPKFIRKKFAPHVRNYSNSEVIRLFDAKKWEIVKHSHVFSGFDKLERKFGFVGKLIKRFFHFAEKTPLHHFGISHFIIAKKR